MLFFQECLRCLEQAPDGSVESNIHYKASGAIYEAEYMIRHLEQKKELSAADANANQDSDDDDN